MVRAFLAAAVCLPLTAAAVELGKPRHGSAISGGTLSVSDSLYYKFNLFLDEDPDDDAPAPFAFHEFVHRTFADLRAGAFSAGAQLDWVAVTPNCSQAPFRLRYTERYGDGCVSPNPVTGTGGWGPMTRDHFLMQLEKIWFRYAGKNVQVELGDVYAAFGRGLVLSMTRKPEIDLDNSLRGGRFDLLTEHVDVTVVGGISNPQEVSMELRNLRIDKVDVHALVAGRLEVRPVRGLELSGHGVGYDLQATRKSAAFGGTVAATGLARGGLDLFFEGDGFVYGDPDAPRGVDHTGYALYGNATAFLGALTLTVEGKRYKNAMELIRPGPVVPLQFNLPPSLEHDPSVTEDVNKAIQSNDIAGWRAQADLWLLASDTTLTVAFANGYELQPHPGYSEQREISVHPQLELRQPIHAGKAELLLVGDIGYRHDVPWRWTDATAPDDAPEGWQDQYLSHTGLLHYKADIGLTVGEHSWELVSTYRRHAVTLAAPECWERAGKERCDRDRGWLAIENSLSYTLKGRYTLAVNVDFTDDVRVQNVVANGSRGNLWYDADFRASAYIGGTLILKPTSAFELSVFGGSQKAGIVCTGGACRTVPAFTGVKARATLHF